MSEYDIWRFVHLLGVILLIGNVTVSSVWKVFADRTRDPSTIAYAQRLITYTDWSLTLGGVTLTVVGAAPANAAQRRAEMHPHWKNPPAIDVVDVIVARTFLRRYARWRVRTSRYAQA